MSSRTAEAIRVSVDPHNPGQFFACCGLLELAGRGWPGAEGWFDEDAFLIRVPDVDRAKASLQELTLSLAGAGLEQLDVADDMSSAIEIGPVFSIRLDWWLDEHAGGSGLKVWAGSMRNVRIARAMLAAMKAAAAHEEEMLNFGSVVFDPAEPDKKVEPFYFDARRGANAQALDLGFAPDTLHMTTTAYPAVEILCLIGLQRGRPTPVPKAPRVFDYWLWQTPIEARLIPAAVSGVLGRPARGFRFENTFRTDQRKHKAFAPASPLRGATS